MEFSLPRTYTILGAHRSGTSFLTKCLIDAGVPMVGGTIHYEDGDFVRLNKEIIQATGGIWTSPPSRQAIIEQGARREDKIVSLLESRKQSMWGWKDPRQALTISSYLPHLDNDVYLIAIFRKPELAGASLERLGQVHIGQGAALSREYSHRILESVKEFVDG